MRIRRAPVVATAIATFLLMLPATAAQVQNEYIVVLNQTNRPVADVATELASAHSGQVGFVYESALQGFTLRIPQAAADGLARNPNVAYIEPVQDVEAVSTQQTATGNDRIDADLNPPTGPMDVQIAILDTGVYIGTREDGSARSHLDLNLKWVSDCTGAILYPLLPGGCTGSGDFQDRHGHGTHVAGIAAAYDNDIGTVGVAPGATLWSFKVLNDDGTGTTGMMLAGIDAVASKADQIDVANMSLGFVGSSQAIDDALASAKAAGVVFVVAAGNDGISASEFTPASSPDVVTVSALSDFDGIPGGLGEPTCRDDVEDDKLATWSNFGPAVEIAAPGVCILSAGLDDGTDTKSGTSMASPYVAGAMARYIAETGAPTNNASDVDAIIDAVLGSAVPQASACGFTDVDNSPEPLLSVNGPAYGGDGTCGEGGEPPANNPPTADFTYECTDLDCTFTDASSDSDGTVVAWEWSFDGTDTSTEQNPPTHTFPAEGIYSVSLTVTDDDADTGDVSYDVTVTTTPPPADPTVTADVAPFSFDGTFGNVSVTVWDDSLHLVGGATVEGEWTYLDKRGRTRTATSSTVSADEFDLNANPIGNAFITKRFPKGSTPIEFCITSVSAPGYDYLPSDDPCVPDAAAESAETVAVRSSWRAA